MKTFTIDSWNAFRMDLSKNEPSKLLGFVPTMGNLHKGHLSLIKKSVSENDYTAVSIFVNPTQFDNYNDLINYPSTLEQDLQMVKACDVDFVIIPDYKSLYPDNYTYKITETIMSQELCGKYRPGHFDGVLTVVMKLFMLVKPHRSYFGEKDWQQLELIKNMTKAFFIDLEIVSCPIVRDIDGLALSSRNNRLTHKQRLLAKKFSELLQNKHLSCTEIKVQLENLGFTIDYVEDYTDRRLGAVRIGDIRLIDNFLR